MNNLVPSETQMSALTLMSKTAALSAMYKSVGSEEQILMILLTANELGLPPMQCLNGMINIIQGKVTISARGMSSMIRRAGHSIKIVESTPQKCTLKGTRADNGDTAEVSFTYEDAKRSGLIKPGSAWIKTPEDMCFARAMSRLARQLFSDVIGNSYVHGEIPGSESIQDAECEEVIDPKKAKSDVLKFVGVDKDDKLWNSYVQEMMKHWEYTSEEVYINFSKEPERAKDGFEFYKRKKVDVDS